MKKVNNKAFTLIELLAVIAILGIIGTIATIAINSTLNKAENDIDVIQEKMIKEAAKAYVLDNRPSKPDAVMTISKNELNDYIDDDSDNDYTVIVSYFDRKIIDITIDNEFKENKSSYYRLVGVLYMKKMNYRYTKNLNYQPSNNGIYTCYITKDNISDNMEFEDEHFVMKNFSILYAYDKNNPESGTDYIDISLAGAPSTTADYHCSSYQ